MTAAFRMLIFSLFIHFAAASAQAADTGPIHSLEVSISPREVNAVSQNTSVSLTFTGSVSIEKLPVERVVISLTASVSSGYPAACTPSTLLFTSSAPQSFVVNVTIPESPPAGVATLTVTADWTGGGTQLSATNSSAINITKPSTGGQTGGATNTTGGNRSRPGTVTPPGTDARKTDTEFLMAAAAAVILTGVGLLVYWVKARH